MSLSNRPYTARCLTPQMTQYTGTCARSEMRMSGTVHLVCVCVYECVKSCQVSISHLDMAETACPEHPRFVQAHGVLRFAGEVGRPQARTFDSERYVWSIKMRLGSLLFNNEAAVSQPLACKEGTWFSAAPGNQHCTKERKNRPKQFLCKCSCLQPLKLDEARQRAVLRTQPQCKHALPASSKWVCFFVEGGHIRMVLHGNQEINHTYWLEARNLSKPNQRM